MDDFTMRKLEEILNGINESNGSRLMDLISNLRKLENIEDIIDIHYLPDGITAFVKTKDEKHYEFVIRPAEYAKNFPK